MVSIRNTWIGFDFEVVFSKERYILHPEFLQKLWKEKDDYETACLLAQKKCKKTHDYVNWIWITHAVIYITFKIQTNWNATNWSICSRKSVFYETKWFSLLLKLYFFRNITSRDLKKDWILQTIRVQRIHQRCI